MSAWGDVYVDLESSWQGTKEFDANAKPNKGGHGAMRNCRCEVDLNIRFVVVDLDELVLGDAELF